MMVGKCKDQKSARVGKHKDQKNVEKVRNDYNLEIGLGFCR